MAEHLYRRPLFERVTNQEHVVSSGVPVPGVHRFLSDPKPGNLEWNRNYKCKHEKHLCGMDGGFDTEWKLS